MRGIGCQHPQQPVETKLVSAFRRQDQVADMRRVKRPAKDPNRLILVLPLQLIIADEDRFALLNPSLTQSFFHSQRFHQALEAPH